MNWYEFSKVNRERSESPRGFGHKLENWSLSDWMTATLGELGEAANVAKKLNRYRDGINGNTEPEVVLRAQLARELADTFIYLDLLAQREGIDLPAAVRKTFNAKSEQLKCPIRFERTGRTRVYIAGPISKGDLVHNLNQATAAFVALAKAGFAPFCPHWSAYCKRATSRREAWGVEVTCQATVEGNDQMTHADWMGVDLPWVEVSDALLRLPGESTGADMEVHHARAHGVPVFHSIEDLVAHFEAYANGTVPA